MNCSRCGFDAGNASWCPRCGLKLNADKPEAHPNMNNGGGVPNNVPPINNGDGLTPGTAVPSLSFITAGWSRKKLPGIVRSISLNILKAINMRLQLTAI